MYPLADRLSRISEPETLAMARRSRELKEKGVDVINLTLGEPDFPTPDIIKSAAKKAIDADFSYYSPVNGFADLREAICRKLKRENHLDYSPNDIVVSTGAKQALANAILSLINPGNEVILCAPYWVSYFDMVKLVQGVPVIVRSTVDQNFKVPPTAIEKAITSKTRMIILNSPSNPSGAVYSRSEMAEIAAIMEKNKDIFILSDEIYEYINYTGSQVSPAEFSQIKERVIIVNGVSKAFAMTGWRLGYLAAPEWIAKACATLQGQFTSGANSITQKAAVTALEHGIEIAGTMRAEYLKRRNRCVELIKKIPDVRMNVPDGAFYLFPDLSAYFGRSGGTGKIDDSVKLSMYLLNEGGVATVPGRSFGSPECIRLSFATSMNNLEEGISRLKKALERLY